MSDKEEIIQGGVPPEAAVYRPLNVYPLLVGIFQPVNEELALEP